jgi:DNA-binding CsgD family transcriptional regulator
LEADLREITSPIVRRMQTLGLTRQEIAVAHLLKKGKTTKEIAASFGVSERAIEFHRYNIRKKLRLETKTNLQSYLLSIT